MTASRFGRVVTFYSYKGGVGRTLAVADVAVMLARLGHRVLAVDWDLEAPGLDVYFREWTGAEPREGLAEMVASFGEVEPEVAARRYEIVPVPGTGDRLGLIRAGRGDPGHARRVQSLDWDERYAAGFGPWLERVRSVWQQEWDFVLVDSRTGISDIGGVCTIQLPEVLIVLFTPSQQSIEGCERIARQAQVAQKALPIDRAPLRVIPVPTRVDSTEYRARRHWESVIWERFGPFIDEWSDAPGRATHVLQALAVPYIPYWSFGERLPAVEGDPTDKLSVENAHQTLAVLLASELADVGRVLDERRGALADVDRAGTVFENDVFVSHPASADIFARALASGLAVHGLRIKADFTIRAEGAARLEEYDQLLESSRFTIAVVEEVIGPLQGAVLERARILAARDPAARRTVSLIMPGIHAADVQGSPFPFGLHVGDFPSVEALADTLAGILTR